MAEAGTSDCETQKNKISFLINKQLKKGDTWYLVESKWYKQWKKYVGFDSWDTSFVGEKSAHPGPIDNSPLLKEDTKELKENLIDELDYQLVPEDAWQMLVEWYEVIEGQDPLPKKVIENGMFVKHCKVEVYLMDLKLSQHSSMENPVTRQFSRADTIEHIEKEMKKLFNINEEKEVRLWNKYMSNTYEQLNKADNTVQDAGLYQGQVIVIEEKGDDGTWPRQVKASASNSSSASNRLGTSNGLTKDSHDEKATRSSSSGSGNTYSGTRSYNYSSSNDSSYHSKSGKPGLCGLSNLGNTCFMNSAIQCMSNVPILTKYFMSGKWEKELNEENPLGMRGEIASSYAQLVKTMWSGKYSYTVPRQFKIAVGRFAPQFSGYQQQDSQELMAFLLDGLHEDLNRIKIKPYVAVKDADGRPDSEVSQEAWRNYLMRNDSVITDTFHGLLKSTLVCPKCEKISVTFDPFCYLSLPLPMKKERQIEVFFVPLKSDKKTKHFKLIVPKSGHVQDLCMALSKKVNVPYKRLVVTDVYNHKFHKVFTSDENLSHIMDRDDIFIYEVPVESADDPETLILPVYNRENKVSNAGSSYSHVTHQLFGTPLLVPIPRKKCTYETLYNCILDRMMRYVNIPENLENWLPASTASNSSGGSDSDNEPMENGDSGEDEPEGKQQKKTPEPFSFSMVNSYGSTDVECIRNDGKPIKFTARSYVAMNWHHHAKSKFYDEKKAEALEVDDSVNTTMPKKTAIQLSDCIDLFTNQEQLGEHDPWYCPRCKKHQEAFKKFDLWQLPQVLVIHLKRFSYNRFWRDKIDTLVEYPVKGLNMRNWVLNDDHNGTTVYDLIAVSNHYGGMGGGHYTAYAKNHEENRWYYFDDSSVSEASSDSPVTKAGYVLVYERRSSLVSPMECNGTNEDEDNSMEIESNPN